MLLGLGQSKQSACAESEYANTNSCTYTTMHILPIANLCYRRGGDDLHILAIIL